MTFVPMLRLRCSHWDEPYYRSPDYQNFASSFAGIAKAYAVWIPSGPARGVFLTVAAVGGAALEGDDPTLTKLVSALHGFGNPLIPITVQSFNETTFGFSAPRQYQPGF